MVDQVHNGDMVSAGICLYDKGWLKGPRMSFYVGFICLVSLSKAIAIFFVMETFVHLNEK